MLVPQMFGIVKMIVLNLFIFYSSFIQFKYYVNIQQQLTFLMISRFLLKQHRTLRRPVLHPFSELKQFQNNFLSTANIAFIEGLYTQWKADRTSVSPSFAAYFQELEKGGDPETSFVQAPRPGSQCQITSSSTYVSQQLKIRMMIERYRSIGHQFAKCDPLGFDRRDFIGAVDPSVLELKAFDFQEAELRQQYELKESRKPDAETKKYTVEDMKNYLEKVYCSTVGYEYTHLLSKEERDFLKKSFEEHIQSLEVNQPLKEESLHAFERLCKDQAFIDFLGTKFGNFKRFGIEGLNSAPMALSEIVEIAAKHGCETVVMGMAHRGRLNTLHCVFDKPAAAIFKEFLQKKDLTEDISSGDVKYHLGYESFKKIGDKQVNLQILPNPSHLETVNPLIYGSVRSIMLMQNDIEGDKSLGVIVHGDAAMAGQGIMYESLQMLDLVDYTPKGIIHIVMNNQIGFTTNPSQARSSYYCTQVAKTIGVPVIHVNANQPAVLNRCVKIAVDFRYKFKKDIFIDIVGFRKHGHNQQDQPAFTQPEMYERINKKRSVFEQYSQRLIKKQILTKEQVEARKQYYLKQYDEDYQKVVNDQYHENYQYPNKFYQIMAPKLWGNSTGVHPNDLAKVFETVTTWPQDFNIHPTIKKIFDQRKKNFSSNEPLDWATMESLAFGTLLYEGFGVRLSGQDVERGTFSHRHAYISDQKMNVPKFCFFKNLSKKVTISNSHLSEYGVLGFEYGYSLQNPNYLTIWEAQFGDFANGAEIMIDNYIVCAEPKWGIQSGLVINLPHGMDGQGPEHSSGRMERFLQLSDDNTDIDQNVKYAQQLRNCNIQVVSCSSSSNYFHALRRQLRRPFRKPLVNFMSKKLLKFKPANRPMTEIEEGTEFMPVYGDDSGNPASGIKRVILCCGQFYYELNRKREQLKLKDTAIVRIEQVAPFPVEHLKQVLSQYGPSVEYSWAQEEHENYGALTFLYPRLKKLLNKPIKIYCRNASASPAVGALKIHKIEEEELLKSIFGY